jgi:hypothetical protein
VLQISDDEAARVWDEYFNLKNSTGETVFDQVLKICLPRPRDVIMFMSRMFESAINNGHSEVKDADFSYAVKEYSKFLYQNIVAEMISEYPNIREILEHLHKNYTMKVDYNKFIRDLSGLLEDSYKIERFVDGMIQNRYLVVKNYKTGERYLSYSAANEALMQSCVKILFVKIRKPAQKVFAEFTPQFSRDR